ncbi:MAG: hypothetical protein BWY93_00317 [Euryarchaeota archaeon ADurb.BinA087]|nr:MAG: hypothetical protein BWY93_00317 [Euryarchaeota archaeon ADurb.BinA087]
MAFGQFKQIKTIISLFIPIFSKAGIKVMAEKEGIGKSRLEALSDGIFAFAMTLLVISLAVPLVPDGEAAVLLPGKIAEMFPEFVIFSIAFFIIAGYWLAHHRILRSIEYVDDRLIWTNLLLLFFIVLIPFTTSISGDYNAVFEAVLLFHINLLCASIALTLIWLYIRSQYAKLTNEEEPENRLKQFEATGRFRALAIPAITIVAIFVSFINPAGSMYCYLLIPVIMVAGKKSSTSCMVE